MIRTIQRKLVKRSPLAMLVLASFVFTACEQAANPQGPTTLSRGLPISADHDGQTYFKGIMFGIGPVAHEIPEIRDHYAPAARGLTAEEVLEVEQVAEEMITHVEKLDPTFFAAFERDIQSNDHVRVQDALQKAGLVLFLAVLQTEEGQKAFGQLKDPEVVDELVSEVNANGGFGDLSRSDFERAVHELENFAIESNGVGAVDAMAGVVVGLVVAVVIFWVAVAVAALAVAAALYLWVVAVAQVALAIDIALVMTRWVFVSQVQPLAGLQYETMIHSIATRY